MKKKIIDKIGDWLVMIVESKILRAVSLVLVVLLFLALFAIGIALNKTIWESDLPDWAKIMLLR